MYILPPLCIEYMKYFYFYMNVIISYLPSVSNIQQQDDLPVSMGLPWSILTDILDVGEPADGGPTRAFISAAIVMNACSTFVEFLALVSKNGILSCSAYCWKIKFESLNYIFQWLRVLCMKVCWEEIIHLILLPKEKLEIRPPIVLQII